MKRTVHRPNNGVPSWMAIALGLGLATALAPHTIKPAQATVEQTQTSSLDWAIDAAHVEAAHVEADAYQRIHQMPDHWMAQFWRRRFRVRSSAYRRGGFSRGASCPVDGQITALTPFVDENDSPLAGIAPTYLTASSHPHFFFYIPQLPTTQGILTIQSSEDTTLSLTERYYYKTAFTVQGDAGVVGIRLPDDAPPLEVGQSYVWRVSVACDPIDIQDSLTVHGGVLERVEAGPGATLDAYADQGIWQEPLSILAEQYYANPTDGAIASNWADLLNSVGLDPAIATAPIVQIMDGQ